MADVKEQIRAALSAALNQFKKEKNIDAPDVEAASLTLENPPDPKMGDVGIPLFAFAKTFRMGPPQISAGVAQILKGADEIGGVKVAGLGEIFDEFRRIAVPSVFCDELNRSCLESRIDFVFVFRGGECKPDYKEDDYGTSNGENFTEKCNTRRGDVTDDKTQGDAQ